MKAWPVIYDEEKESIEKLCQMKRNCVVVIYSIVEGDIRSTGNINTMRNINGMSWL